MLTLLRDRIPLIFLILLICLTILQIGSRIPHNRLDFDEAYNLQIPLNLHTSGQYTTFDRILDVNITTGPTVLIPAALLYNAAQPMLPRLITVLYTIIFLLFLLTKFFSKRFEKILYLILINVTPLFFLFSTVILGEVPAFVFLFFSYVAFTRSKFFSAGILFALSILTKSNYIIGGAPFLIYGVYAVFVREENDTVLNKLILFISGFILPICLWELYKLSVFQYDVNRYITYSKELIAFTRSHAHIQPNNIEKRLAMIGYTLHIGGALFIFILMFISGYTIFKQRNHLIKMLGIFTLIYTLHYICYGTTDWYRHFFPALLSLLLIIPSFIISFFGKLNFERRLLIGVMIIMLGISVFGFKNRDKNQEFTHLLVNQNLLFLEQSPLPYIRDKKILTDQYSMANYIKTNIRSNEKISGFTWLNSPEIAYLTGRRIYRNPEKSDVDYVLSSIYNRFLDPDATTFIKQSMLEPIYSNDTYTLYKKFPYTFSKL